MKTTTAYEMECMRHNVTPAQFLAYVRAQGKKKNVPTPLPDEGLDYLRRNDDWNIDYRDGLPTTKPAAAERNIERSYEKQTYILNFDGSLYSEQLEFNFWDDKMGTGYYYIVEKTVDESDKAENEAEYIEKACARIKRDAERDLAKAAKIREHIEKEGQWLSEYHIETESWESDHLERKAQEALETIAAYETHGGKVI